MTIEDKRRQVLAEIDAWNESEQLSPEQLMQRVLGVVESLADLLDSESTMTRYLWCMVALKLHLQHATLKARELNALFTTTRTLLQLNRVTPFGHKQSYLYGDIEIVASQVAMKDGKVWTALWHQASAEQHEGRSKRGIGGFLQLGKAIRLARLGFYQLSLDELGEAKKKGLSPVQMSVHASCLAKCLRMTQKYDEFDSAVTAAIITFDGHQNCLEELRFESACVTASRFADLGPMYEAYYPSEHNTNFHRYIAELYLWAMALPSDQWLLKLPNYYQLSKRGIIAAKQIGPLHKIVSKLSKLYDNEIPINKRLESIADWYDHSRLAPSFDKEILTTAAIKRWLEREGIASLLSPLSAEYQSQSLRATSGANGDALGLWTGVGSGQVRSLKSAS